MNRLSFIFALILVAGIYADPGYDECLAGEGGIADPSEGTCYWLDSAPADQGSLPYCSVHESSSCCIGAVAAQLKIDLPFDSSIYGGDCCSQNIEALHCAINCGECGSVSQDIIETEGEATLLRQFITQEYADNIYESCENVCINGDLISETYSTSAAFIASLGRTFTGVEMEIAIGTSSVDAAYDGIVLDACETDLVGCQDIELTEETCQRLNEPFNKSWDGFCGEYFDDLICCAQDKEQEFEDHCLTKIIPLFGEGGCYENIKRLHCFWLCGPSYNMTVWDHNDLLDVPTMTFYVSPMWAEGIYQSCKDVCLSLGGGYPIRELYANGEEFIQLFQSRSDPTFDPTENDAHETFYFVDKQPDTGEWWSGTYVGPTEDDTFGCEAVESSSSDAAKLTFSSLSLFFFILINII